MIRIARFSQCVDMPEGQYARSEGPTEAMGMVAIHPEDLPLLVHRGDAEEAVCRELVARQDTLAGRDLTWLRGRSLLMFEVYERGEEEPEEMDPLCQTIGTAVCQQYAMPVYEEIAWNDRAMTDWPVRTSVAGLLVRRDGQPFSMPSVPEWRAEVVNLTPHVIRLTDGREYPPSSQVARVTATYSSPEGDPPIARVTFGEVTGLPIARRSTTYIVSSLVAQAACREDVVSPATGHPDAVRRDGQVWSVPCFVRA